MHEHLPKKKQYFKAFTLIEILVAISIMAILFTIGIANFRGVQRSKSLDAVKNQIIGDLRQAQEYAQASFKPCTGELQSVEFSVTSENSYEVTVNCDDGAPNSSSVKAITLNTYTLSPNTGSVEFYPVAGGVSGSLTITISSSTTTETSTITINDAGEIF
ncbi:type II secretion system protein [Candidatus Woesebacteria bacterium]|nr:type II secretion system protein [Candidatus Woesebacteria bacterium]